jgi:hypothetical protein
VRLRMRTSGCRVEARQGGGGNWVVVRCGREGGSGRWWGTRVRRRLGGGIGAWRGTARGTGAATRISRNFHWWVRCCAVLGHSGRHTLRHLHLRNPPGRRHRRRRRHRIAASVECEGAGAGASDPCSSIPGASGWTCGCSHLGGEGGGRGGAQGGGAAGGGVAAGDGHGGARRGCEGHGGGHRACVWRGWIGRRRWNGRSGCAWHPTWRCVCVAGGPQGLGFRFRFRV